VAGHDLGPRRALIWAFACGFEQGRRCTLGVAPGLGRQCPAPNAGRSPAGADAARTGWGRQVRRIASPAQEPAAPPGRGAARGIRPGAGRIGRVGLTNRGLGFGTACSTAGRRGQMSAWSSFPVTAGTGACTSAGVNSAVPRANLNSGAGRERGVRRGWPPIRSRFGLQAPSNSCGCSGITRSRGGRHRATAGADGRGSTTAQGGWDPLGNPVLLRHGGGVPDPGGRAIHRR